MNLAFDRNPTSEVVQRISNWRQGEVTDVIVPFVESIFELYLKSDVDDRRKIREAVLAHQVLWNFTGQDDIGVYLNTLGQNSDFNIVPYLRAWLICISITGGMNWKDTLCLIESLHGKAVLQEVDIRPHVEEIASSADDSDRRGGQNGEMSTRDLILWVLHAPLNVNREELIRRKQEQEAERLAQQEWGGKVRSCPKCSTAFKSNFDLGQCPQCGKRFHASRTTR